jgi:hypothetical protein
MDIIKHSETEREGERERLMGFACALLRKNLRSKWWLEARSEKPRLRNFFTPYCEVFDRGLDL